MGDGLEAFLPNGPRPGGMREAIEQIRSPLTQSGWQWRARPPKTSSDSADSDSDSHRAIRRAGPVGTRFYRPLPRIMLDLVLVGTPLVLGFIAPYHA